MLLLLLRLSLWVGMQSKDAIVRGQYPCTIDEAVTVRWPGLAFAPGSDRAESLTSLALIRTLGALPPLVCSHAAACGIRKPQPRPPQAGVHRRPSGLPPCRIRQGVCGPAYPGWRLAHGTAGAGRVQVKGVEKKIYADHKKLMGMTELTVKHKYITVCRSLNTYGITFFSVKEKAKGKNKLLPCLLGITRESVMRMDERTKEVRCPPRPLPIPPPIPICRWYHSDTPTDRPPHPTQCCLHQRQVLRTWPLTTVRRWVATANSFTLDFGDYADFYSVQTEEGDTISQLIAGRDPDPLACDCFALLLH
jgi:hypothetical protein